MANDELVFIIIVVFVIVTFLCFVCCKVCCEDDEESAGQTAENPQNQRNVGQYNVITTEPTLNTQANNNYNHIGFTFSPTQPNQSNLPMDMRSPQVPSAPEFDNPPNYDDAVKHFSQGQKQQA